jgi:hypothetical protein
MIKFDDWRPFWARVLMPVRDTPATHRAEIRAAFSPHEYRRTYATTSSHMAQVGCSYPLSPYPGNTQRSCDGLRNNPEPIDQSEHWASRKTMGKLATVGWGRCCPDGRVNFSAYSVDCGALRRLQMALVKASDRLARSVYRVAEATTFGGTIGAQAAVRAVRELEGKLRHGRSAGEAGILGPTQFADAAVISNAALP